MSKKWTSWIEHTGDTCPVGVREKIKFKTVGRSKAKRFAGHLGWARRCINHITHYKRLIKNVEAEKAKEAPTTPQPVITGVGEYRIRCGDKVYIDAQSMGGWFGIFVNSGERSCWDSLGLHLDGNQDIVGSWEDKAEVKPERWANVYQREDGTCFLGQMRRTSRDQLGGILSGGGDLVGPILLSHTEGDE